MKCSICGTESKVDARFCSGCGATLVLPKTDETMLDLRTALYRRPVIVPAVPPGANAASAPVGKAPSANPPRAIDSAPSKSTTGALVLVLIAVGFIAYFVYQVATTLGAPWIAALTSASSPPMQSVETQQSALPAVDKVAELAPPVVRSPTPVPATPPTTSEVAPPAAVEPKVAAPLPTSPKRSSAPAAAKGSSAGKSAAKPASPSKSAAAAPRRAAAKAPAAATDPEPLPPAGPMTAPAPAVAPEPAPPQPDRWQEMSDALANCAQENFIGRVVCEQRLRFRYCNGYWGRVAQCPDAQNPNPAR